MAPEVSEVEVVNHPTWTHFIVYIIVMVLVAGGGWFMGIQTGKLQGALIAFKSNPPNTYNGTTTVDQSIKKMGYMFGIKPAKSWGIGICHD